MANKGTFNGRTKQGPREKSELFIRRRNRQEFLDWSQLDETLLLAALSVASTSGATLSISPALGGIGVTVRLYRGETADSEYAGSIAELEELLELICEGLQGSGENALAAMRFARASREKRG